VSFTIPRGSITMLIGPNGSGKTTLLKMMVGLLIPTQGVIEVLGASPHEQRGHIGYVPQRLAFDHEFPLTVLEFLHLSARETPTEELMHLLNELNIEHLASQVIGKLSGGQLQRVLIARSLLGNPEIIFLDEPVSGIDIGGEENFYELIHKIQQQREITVVMVSHEVHIVHRVADNVICLNKEMLCSGSPSEALLPEVMEKLYGDNVSLYEHHC
jgi:zinc transport system ATP-binding protein